MPESNSWFEELNEGPYAAQLAKGFVWLRFGGVLESEFRQFNMRQNYRLRLWCLYFGITMWLLFALADQLLIASCEHWWMSLLVRLLVFAALLSLLRPLRTEDDERKIDRLIISALLILGAGVAVIISLGHTANQSYPYDGLILISFAVYFLAGLRLAQAIAVSLALLLLYALLETWAGYPPTLLFSNLFFLLAGNLIAGMGCYLLEYKSREQFLNHHLMRQLADHDSLTGLHNRRSFNRKAQLRLRQSRRDKVPMVLLVCDIDHFKAFNDGYGHQQGDHALRQLGRVIGQAARRPLDLAVRMGGEEFAVLLYDMSREQALAHAEGLRLAVLELEIAHARSDTAAALSISIGLACTSPAAVESLEQLYESADKALYRAKAAGRNQVMPWI